MNEYLDLAKKVGEDVKNSHYFKRYKELNNITSEKYKEEMKAFTVVKNQFNVIMHQGGQHHPDYRTKAQEFSKLKEELYNKPEFIELLELEQLIQGMLNNIVRQLSDTVSSYVKYPSDLGILPKGNKHESK